MLKKPIIEVNNVSMRFNLSKEKTDKIKEYCIKFVKGKLFFYEFPFRSKFRQ